MCNLEYPSSLLLLFHQMSELDHVKLTEVVANKTIQCYICGANFDSNRDMQLHFRNHLLCQYCEICNEQLNFRELGEHLCDEEEVMQCEYCSEPFNATIKLVQHLNTKHDGTLHKCGKCSKMYKMAQLRDIHEAYHPKEKPKIFSCDECTKKFSSEKLLKCHILLHTNESKNKRKLNINFLHQFCTKCFHSQGILCATNAENPSKRKLHLKDIP